MLFIILPFLQPIAQSQHGEDAIVQKRYFSGKTTGVFVEIGALDGIALSNTMRFEQLGWTGLLVEGQKKNYLKLLSNMGRRRNAVALHSAICQRASMTNFTQSSSSVSVDLNHGDRLRLKHWHHTIRPAHELVPCFPLSTLFRGHKHIDFFSLDIEGGEYDALKTVDWDYNTFGLFMIEVFRAGRHDRAQQDRIVRMLEDKGYSLCEVRLPNIFMARQCPVAKTV